MNRALPFSDRSTADSTPPRFISERARAVAMCVVVALLASVLPILHTLHFAHRDDFDRQVWPLPAWRALETLELRDLDARFARRGAQTPNSRDRIAIVGLDDNSYTRINRNPVPRGLHARLVQRLLKAGARVVAFDIGFSERQNPRDDAALEGALKNASGRVLLASFFSNDANAQTQSHQLASPLERFDSKTPDLALTLMPRDADGRVRRVAFRTVLSGENVGALSALAAASYQGLLDGNENPRYETALKSGDWPAQDGHAVRVPTSKQSAPTNSVAPRPFTTPLLFWGPPGSFATYSYANALWDWSPAQMQTRFRDRIVFVGSTSALDKDLFQTPPFSTQNSADERAAETFGVELHATATAMLLDGRFLRVPGVAWQIATVIALALLSCAWTLKLGVWAGVAARRGQGVWATRDFPGRVYALVYLCVFGLGAALPALMFEVFAQAALARDVWIVTIYPLFAMLGGAGVMLLSLYGGEASERRRVTSHMGRLVSPDVLDELLAHPEGVSLAPRRAEVTVLFTDLQGFTSYAEAHSPEEVAWAREAYLNRMTPLVHAHGGSLDKFIGDAVMAFFGAPIPRYDHAAQALHCAVAMQDECARFREETGIPFYMRIGVHTGCAVVGLMGEARAEYTVIGDTVNLAARLESLNKEFDSRVLCSQQTHDAAPGMVEVERYTTQVRGKHDAVNVCVVRGLAGAPRDDNWKPLPDHPPNPALDPEPKPLRALPAGTPVAISSQ